MICKVGYSFNGDIKGHGVFGLDVSKFTDCLTIEDIKDKIKRKILQYEIENNIFPDYNINIKDSFITLSADFIQEWKRLKTTT